MTRSCIVIPLALLLAGCADSPAGPSVPAGREFQVRPGESVVLEGTDLALRFDRVASDSRCPADVLCVTQGDAVAVVSVTREGRPATGLLLHTEPGEGQRVTIDEWILTLSSLDPYPHLSRPIAPSDYRATLRVDPAGA